MTTFVKRIANGLIAAQMLFGTVAVSTVMSAAPADAAIVLRQHGSWRGIAASANGESGFGVMTEMDDGGTASVVASGDTIALILTDSKWNWKVGEEATVSVSIDGELFTGTAVVSATDTVRIAGLSIATVRRFAAATAMTVDVGNGSIVWNIGLMGFTASMGDAARAYKTSY